MQPQPQSEREIATISIIVPTRNEQRNLPRLLGSIAAQRDVDAEVIVVDQESEDDTVSIAQNFGAKVITRPKPAFYSPPAISRNIGAEQATGSVLFHLDADMELPDEGFLQRAVALVDDDHRAAVIHERDIAQGWWNRVKAAERDCYWDTPIEGARVVTKRLFDEVGGYDSAISSGEDMHIHQLYSAQTQIAKANDVWLKHHTGHIPLRRLLNKKFNYGRTSASFLERSQQIDGHSSSSWMRESLRAYATHMGMVRKRPLAYACIIPLRIMELVALRLGMRRGARA